MTNAGYLFRATVTLGALVGSMALPLLRAESAYAAREDSSHGAYIAMRSEGEGDDFYAAPTLTGGNDDNKNKSEKCANEKSTGKSSAGKNSAGKNSAGKNSAGKNSGGQSSAGNKNGCAPGENQNIPFVPLAAAYPAVGAATFAAAYGLRRRRSAKQ